MAYPALYVLHIIFSPITAWLSTSNTHKRLQCQWFVNGFIWSALSIGSNLLVFFIETRKQMREYGLPNPVFLFKNSPGLWGSQSINLDTLTWIRRLVNWFVYTIKSIDSDTVAGCTYLDTSFSPWVESLLFSNKPTLQNLFFIFILKTGFLFFSLILAYFTSCLLSSL